MQSQSFALHEFLPSTPEGWTQDGNPLVYNTETLYDYIDGGAELYISFNMDSVISIRFTNVKYGEIRVEIFNMNEPRNAFGVFSHTRTKNQKEFGNGSQYFTGAQIFWKGQFYVTIIADDENPEIQKAIKSIAKEIDSKITVTGDIPAIIQLLPEENMVEDGFIYFHHYIWLNAYYFISTDNILNIDSNTDAVMAKYNMQGQRTFLLLLKYPSNELAREAFENFNTSYIENTATGKTMQLEDKTYLGCRMHENYIIVAFNGGTSNSVEELLTKCEQNIQ